MLTLSAHGRSANARSVVAIMALGVRQGDELIIQAGGADAAQSVAGLVAGIQEAQRMEAAAGHHRRAKPREAAGACAHAHAHAGTRVTGAGRGPGVGPGVLSGVTAVAGLAVGRAARLERREIAVIENGAGCAREMRRTRNRREPTCVRGSQRVAATGGAVRSEIIGAHLEFLDDPQLNEEAHALIAAGKSAGFAWRAAIRRSIAALEALDDSHLRERADDLLDVESHVLLALAGEAQPLHIPLPEQAVLIADDLLPSELTALDRRRLAAICLGGGGATSHVAILAAAMEIPMLVGLGAGIREVADGATVIVRRRRAARCNGPRRRRPSSRRDRRSNRNSRAAPRCAPRHRPNAAPWTARASKYSQISAMCSDADGGRRQWRRGLRIAAHRVPVHRSRSTAPDEDEQLAAYQSIAAALAPRPLILRLMDVGGDKPLRYLPLPAEENPALGLRGIRTALARPDLLRSPAARGAASAAGGQPAVARSPW